MYLHDKQSSEYLLKLLASHLVLEKVLSSYLMHFNEDMVEIFGSGGKEEQLLSKNLAQCVVSALDFHSGHLIFDSSLSLLTCVFVILNLAVEIVRR
jgi:hypothetical protein